MSLSFFLFSVGFKVKIYSFFFFFFVSLFMGDSESCSSRQSEWSPVQSRKRRQKVEVFHDVLDKLRELDVEEGSEPGFEDGLWAHFSMLPLR